MGHRVTRGDVSIDIVIILADQRTAATARTGKFRIAYAVYEKGSIY